MARTPAELPVAVFDSGVGGLTVLHELLVSLPTEDYVYLGDTARFPYGERTQAELRAFAIEIADHLLDAAAPSCWWSRATPPARRRWTRSRSTLRTGVEVDVIGVVAPATQLAVAGSRTGGSGCWRRRRPSPAAPTSARCARPTRTSTSRAWPARTWRRSSSAGLPFDEDLIETVRGLLRAAASR